jgi:SAM-dependent methyltransferase
VKDKQAVHEAVRKSYAGVVTGAAGGCCGSAGCCGDAPIATTPDQATRLGYSDEDIQGVPAEANLGLGCGNPRAIAELSPGETVVDLGCGAGFDCFLAAAQVGTSGRVIGVDMTPEMLAKARHNARQGAYANIEFRLGEIENLPVADGEADVILSNCVINLSPDKPAVFREAFRVLKPGGRLAVSDVLAIKPLPEAYREDAALLCGCVAGAATVQEVLAMLTDAGFSDALVEVDSTSKDVIAGWFPGTGAEEFVASAAVRAVKRAG